MASRLPPVSPETVELMARLCYGMMQVHYATLGVGPTARWDDCPFQVSVREAVALIMETARASEAEAADNRA